MGQIPEIPGKLAMHNENQLGVKGLINTYMSRATCRFTEY
jgi:hypothetical protein